MKCALFITFIILSVISSANALIYYQQDWASNGNHALLLGGSNAPFDPNCIISFGNINHGEYVNSTIVSPNYAITVSVAHWGGITKGCRIKTIGNKNLYLGKDANGIAHYSSLYIIADRHDISGADLSVVRLKKAKNPADMNIPEPDPSIYISRYDWINDPNGYFEDADFDSYIQLYSLNDEANQDVVIAGCGPHRIFGIHAPLVKNPCQYAVAPGILHWGYNQISYVGSGSIGVSYNPNAQSGEMPNEVGVGMLDSGTGVYIYEPLVGMFKISNILTSASLSSTSGPRVSNYLDEIAQNVAQMGTPTFADRVLGGLKPNITVSYQIENNASALNPGDPNSDELIITMTADNLSEFVNKPDLYSVIFLLDVPDVFDREYINPNSDFIYDSSCDRMLGYIDLQTADPCYPITQTAILKISRRAEPMSSVEIKPSTMLDFIWERQQVTITCDIANWTDPCSQQGVIYVNAAANESTSGTSWSYPYKTLQEAFARAIKSNSGISQIWLAAGTYTADEGQSFAIDKNMEIYGGFVGGETNINQRINVAGKTILTVSDITKNVLWLSTENASRSYVLDGLTVTGSEGSGIYLRRNTADIRHCVITGNGFGIAGNNATLAVQDCVLTFNGCGLDMSFSGIALDKNIFAFNYSDGLKLNGCGFSVANSVSSENQSNGLYFISPTSTEILNCDIVNNAGYGLYGISGGATTRINNCIVFGNLNDAIPTGQYIGHNVQTDPIFQFPYVQDSNTVMYYLSSISNSCLNMGATGLVYYYPLDLYGRGRVVDNVVDIGAVELEWISTADFNLDGAVDFLDYAEFALRWETSAGDPIFNVKYDLNSNGTIGFEDLMVFASQWLPGHSYTGTVTSTYRVDFGYRMPERQMMMQTLSMRDGISQEYDMSEPTIITAEINAETQLEVARNILINSTATLAIEEQNVTPVIPQINIAQQQQTFDTVNISGIVPMAVNSFGMECIEVAESAETIQEAVDVESLLNWLDDMWQNEAGIRNSMTEADYLEFRNAIGNAK
jgi:hypothetical protein